MNPPSGLAEPRLWRGSRSWTDCQKNVRPRGRDRQTDGKRQTGVDYFGRMEKEREAPSEERWVAPLFLTLALLQLVPIWWFTVLPTADGPTHVYNSWIVRQLVLGRDDVLARTYRIDWRPYPNWLGHAAMAALLGIFPPTVTEKIFFSAIVILFLAAAWKYAGLGGWGARANAFLA